jgi:hypothetical protein
MDTPAGLTLSQDVDPDAETGTQLDSTACHVPPCGRSGPARPRFYPPVILTQDPRPSPGPNSAASWTLTPRSSGVIPSPGIKLLRSDRPKPPRIHRLRCVGPKRARGKATRWAEDDQTDEPIFQEQLADRLLEQVVQASPCGVGVPPLGGKDRLKPGLQPANSQGTEHR